MKRPSYRRSPALFPVLFALVTAASLPSTSGCAGGHALVRRDTAGLATLSWFSPAVPTDRVALERWSAAVGPPVHRAAPASVSAGDTLVVVSWNTALGAGNVAELLTDVRAWFAGAPVVLLLQEVYRGGPEVPSALTPLMAFAGRLGAVGVDRTRDEVESIAERHGLHAYYVPSMRNGSPALSDEDRGNAILSTLPLRDLAAIELPFERQRRVAVAASISGTTSTGAPWTMRLASAHLDNMVGARRLWLAGGEYARTRQARALIDYFRDADTVVLGGDFNTWFGFADRAYTEVAAAFPSTAVRDRRATFYGLLRLDHLFFRLPAGWRAEFQRASHRYGSDHYPLIGTIDLTRQ